MVIILFTINILLDIVQFLNDLFNDIPINIAQRAKSGQ